MKQEHLGKKEKFLEIESIIAERKNLTGNDEEVIKEEIQENFRELEGLPFQMESAQQQEWKLLETKTHHRECGHD